MSERIQLYDVADLKQCLQIVYNELEKITNRSPLKSNQNQTPLLSSCEVLISAGARHIVAQRDVQDPDFSAEFSSYYSKQFSEVKRWCTRLHFFKSQSGNHKSPITFIDNCNKDSYLGFITLRPIIISPVGASILSKSLSSSYIRCADHFPVYLMGKEFSVNGTPFMQQDNAVGACAQASIWMALRTLRKREGDRAHDPAQITDAATKYNLNGRIKPNREGLTKPQMIEAIRAAGYSPHSIYLEKADEVLPMSQKEINAALIKIHPYVESEIPVILLLSSQNNGHAVVAIGHTWNANPKEVVQMEVSNSIGMNLSFTHAVTWIPEIIVHNDNSGPYLVLPQRSQNYSVENITYAIALLPLDVFMSAEEALFIGLTFISNLYDGFNSIYNKDVLTESASKIAIRTLLVEKRKLRKWAAETVMGDELKNELRLMNLPKRVWVLELHLKDHYGAQETVANSLVGFILIDPTGDDVSNSVLMVYQNKFYPLDIPWGTIILFSSKTGLPLEGKQINDVAPLAPIRS